VGTRRLPLRVGFVFIICGLQRHRFILQTSDVGLGPSSVIRSATKYRLHFKRTPSEGWDRVNEPLRCGGRRQAQRPESLASWSPILR
jgi:hypothetical protein